MPCSCHTPAGGNPSPVALPDDQCITCARKHIMLAWSKWGEFCYEDDYRDYCAAQLRAAVDHLKFTYRDFALLLRDLAIIIETNKDADRQEIAQKLRYFLQQSRNMFYTEHPDARERLNKLVVEEPEKIDLIVPLGNGSKSNNDELRILLRSAEKNLRNLGRVIIPTVCPPDWLRNAYIIPIADDLKHNKDGNMINKVLGAAKMLNVRKFVLSADDNVFCQIINAADIPVLYLNNGRSRYKEDGNNWQKRMIATFDFWKSRGIDLQFNYEAHCPQVFDFSKIITGIKDIPYEKGIGFSIYTTFRLCSGPVEGVNCTSYKTTHEIAESAIAPIDKLFCGYNDNSFLNGLKTRLFKMFPEKSKYEN